MKTHYIKNLDQARLLTDPFKLKLLESFATTPRTTKQVADLLGEKAPRLYRHVEALATAGLLELVEERPKRGTVERYYRTIATRFEVEAQTISRGSKKSNDSSDLIRKLMRETTRDLVKLAEQEPGASVKTEHIPIIAKLSISASEKQILRLRQKLQEWMDECTALADDEGSETKKASKNNAEDIQISALLAFYPSEK